MTIRKPNYERWKFLPMTNAQKQDAQDLRIMFHAALSAMEFTPKTVDNLTIEFRRACVTLTPQERKDGAYHRYRDGKPFMRVRVAVKEETKETAGVVHALINNLRVDKWIKTEPFAIEFDTREKLSEEMFDSLYAAIMPQSPLAKRRAAGEADDEEFDPGCISARLRQMHAHRPRPPSGKPPQP
jgi:hypothetical protein